MHGLINRIIERFVRDTYGRDTWVGIMQKLDLGFVEFEPMLTYDKELTVQLLDLIAERLDKPLPDVLEDIGTYLVSHPNVEAVRRLLRFSGKSFVEFLHSLDDLPARARLAVEGLQLPSLELREHGPNFYSVVIGAPPGGVVGFGHVMSGLLRTMADDYGALVFLDHKGQHDDMEIVEVRLLEAAFTEGRDFDLGARAG
jgi:hypothetical protein